MSLFGSLGSKLEKIFSSRKLDESFYENLEDILIEGDFGAKYAMQISDIVKENKPKTEAELTDIVKNILEERICGINFNLPEDELNVILVLGVNGVGKTTTIAKLASYYKKLGYSPVLSASDTFRAAAIDQLCTHAEKTGCRIVHQENGSDPGAVVFDAISSAIAKKDNLILCDTAGRMHNKENLMRELQKIDKIVKAKVNESNYKKILVLDATTGQNAVSQAMLFNEAVGIDALVLSKYDSSSKAGALVQIGIPVAFVGTGEHYEDLHEFNKEEFIKGLLGF